MWCGGGRLRIGPDLFGVAAAGGAASRGARGWYGGRRKAGRARGTRGLRARHLAVARFLPRSAHAPSASRRLGKPTPASAPRGGGDAV